MSGELVLLFLSHLMRHPLSYSGNVNKVVLCPLATTMASAVPLLVLFIYSALYSEGSFQIVTYPRLSSYSLCNANGEVKRLSLKDRQHHMMVVETG